MARPKRNGKREVQPRDVLSHPLRALILSACSRGEVSTSAFAEQHKLKRATVRYHCRVLLDAGYVEIAREVKDRGCNRRYYRAVRQAVLRDEEFAEMAGRERHGMSAVVVWDIFDQFEKSQRAGLKASEVENLFSWWFFLLDLPGWTSLMDELMRVYFRGFEIQTEALNRLKMIREPWRPMTFALAGFESPKPALIEGPGLMHRHGMDPAVATELHDRCKEAMQANTMDARDDSHLTWSPFILDRKGWDDMHQELRTCSERSKTIYVASSERLRMSGGEPIPTTMALIGFESPLPLAARKQVRLEWPPALPAVDD